MASDSLLVLFAWIRFTRRCFRRFDIVAEGNRGGGSELLIVFVANGLLDALVEFREVQSVVGDGIGREPVLAVDLFAVSFELGEAFPFLKTPAPRP